MTTKGKHLTLNDREYIEDSLNAGCTLASIAKHLDCDPTTISKEIKRSKVVSGKVKSVGQLTCDNRMTCVHKNICPSNCNRLCKKCQLQNCYRICPHYKSKTCVKLSRFPHVCNGCHQKLYCKLQKYKYRSKVAQSIYEENLVVSQEGISLSKSELLDLDKLISPLVLKGQSLAHIYAHHGDEIKCSRRTLYAYFEQNLFKARHVDLPRKVRYKPRKKRTDNSIEKTHEYIRYILPKGKSFNELTQEKVTLMANHINSTARANLNDCTPFKLAQLLLDETLLNACKLQHITCDEVHLKPALLK